MTWDSAAHARWEQRQLDDHLEDDEEQDENPCQYVRSCGVWKNTRTNRFVSEAVAEKINAEFWREVWAADRAYHRKERLMERAMKILRLEYAGEIYGGLA